MICPLIHIPNHMSSHTHTQSHILSHTHTLITCPSHTHTSVISPPPTPQSHPSQFQSQSLPLPYHIIMCTYLVPYEAI